MTSTHRHPALTFVSNALNEAVMGFLALVALATAIGPLVFDVSANVERLLNVVEILILALFIAEFLCQFALARDRGAWLRSPWRIVDAACIAGPLLSFLPQVSDTVRGALVFRFLRVGRAVAFGARASAQAVQNRRDLDPSRHRGAADVTVVLPGAEGVPRPSTWAALLEWAPGQAPAWFHVSDVGRERFQELASAAGIPERDRSYFHEIDGHPQLKSYPGGTSLFLWLPTVSEDRVPRMSRNRLFIRVTDAGVLTATSLPFDLPQALASRPAADPGAPLSARTTSGLLALLGDRYKFVSQRYEDEIRRLEELGATERGTRFLREAFGLQREISAASADLWRLKGTVQKLADGKVLPDGPDARTEPFVDNVLGEIEEIDVEFSRLKDELKSLMELHMNITSFEMNKFMKLLAIVGFLGLIPSVAGGLLGMNVLGNPWSVTLGQVAFGIAMGMATSLYVFAIKGWLR